MGRVYYIIGHKEVIINYPNDQSGHYLIEWNNIIIGQLFIDGVHESGSLIWKGTTADVNLFANELGKFVEHTGI